MFKVITATLVLEINWKALNSHEKRLDVVDMFSKFLWWVTVLINRWLIIEGTAFLYASNYYLKWMLIFRELIKRNLINWLFSHSVISGRRNNPQCSLTDKFEDFQIIINNYQTGWKRNPIKQVYMFKAMRNTVVSAK